MMTPQRGSFALGLIVGLLAGLALALGVALYITKVPVPFINKVPHRSAEQDAAEVQRNKDWDPNAPLAGKNPAKPSAPVASGTVDGPLSGAAAVPPPLATTPVPINPPASATSAGRAASGAVAAASAASASRSNRDPASILAGKSPASAPTRSTAGESDAFVYFVQAGAYSRAEDAEQQRAKLAMLGLDARVTEREQSGRTVFRVRVGPFDRRDDADTAQGRLGDAKVETNLVRVER
jgi:cell division protein FtsN